MIDQQPVCECCGRESITHWFGSHLCQECYLAAQQELMRRWSDNNSTLAVIVTATSRSGKRNGKRNGAYLAKLATDPLFALIEEMRCDK